MAPVLDKSARAVRAGRLPALAITCILAGVVAVHGGLVDVGQWGGDEYLFFFELRELGSMYFWARLLHWSARPFSEALLCVYYWLITAAGRPLIGPFLSGLWILCIGGSLAHIFRAGRIAIVPRLLLGTAVMAAFLLGHRVSEMFYWPMGAVAYLPTLASVTYLTFALLDWRHCGRRERIGIVVALLLAAGTSELGALFVAGFVPLSVLLHWLRRGDERSPILWWTLVPFLLALAVVGMTGLGRAQANVGRISDGPILHHLWPSIGAALIQMCREFLSLDAGVSGWRAVSSGALARILLFLGFRWCLRRGNFAPVPATYLLALSIAFIATCFASLVMSHDLYGDLCCQRLDTFRQCAYVLVLLAMAALGLDRRPAGVLDRAIIGPAALLAASALAFDGRGAELLATYRLYSAAEQARVATWRNAAGTAPDMEFRDDTGPLTRHIVWPAGRFVIEPSTPWYVLGVGRFFDKQTVTIAAPR